jgi:hypothetical protein
MKTEINNTNKPPNERAKDGAWSKKKVLPIVAIVFSVGGILAMIFGRWVLYWIYYMPFYSIFNNSIYLPFYLYGASYLLIAGFVNVMVLTYKGNKLRSKIIVASITVVILFSFERNVYKDIVFINTDKYKTMECDIKTVRKVSSGGSRSHYYKYYIKGNEEINGRFLSIEMDFYQYQKLKKIQDEYRNGIILIYYLPNTKRMLNRNK